MPVIYTALLDDQEIFNPAKDLFLGAPVLELEDNSSGTFSFEIYPDHPAYRTICDQAQKVITFKRDDEILWKGRILRTEAAFDGTVLVSAEGELGYLDDTIQRPAEYHNESVRSFLVKLINAHNQKAGLDKQFTVGAVTVADPNDSIYRYTNWESTLAVISDKLLDRLGGHLRIRYEGDTRYLDYLADSPKTASQTIDFGENLLDYIETRDGTDIATVCIPLGAALEEKSEGFPEALEERVTIASVNSGSDEISAAGEALAKYGRITKTVTFDDVHTPQMLKDRGTAWLTDNQFENVELNVTALDLARFGLPDAPFDLLDRIRCRSEPHSLDRTFPLRQMSIHPLEPDTDTFTLGAVSKTFTGSVSEAQKSIDQKIKSFDTSSILKEALKNAQEIMNSLGKSGHVVLRSNEILIMDTEDIDTAKNVWRWNAGGFAHSSNGYEGPYNVAITMDGHIAGQVISAGSLEADRLTVNARKTLEKYTDDALKGYWTKVETEAQIKAAAEQIELSVTDRLAVNENLLTNTRNPQNTDGLYGKPGSAEPYFVYNQAFRENAFRSYVKANATEGTSIYTSSFRFKPSTTYCLSFDYNYIFAPFTVTAFLEYKETEASTTLRDPSYSILLNAGTARAHITFTTPQTIYEGHIRIKGTLRTADTVERNIYFNKIKLEEGSKPTAYDINTSTLVNQSSLKIMSDKIESRITSADAESLIEQKADSIRVRAKKLSWSSANSSMSSDGTLKCKNAEISGTMRTGYSSTNSPGITLQNGVLSLRPTLTAPASATIEYSSPYWETYYTSSGEGGDMVTDGKTPDNRAASINCLRSFLLDIGDIYINEGSEYGYPVARRGWTGMLEVSGYQFKFIKGICVMARRKPS